MQLLMFDVVTQRPKRRKCKITRIRGPGKSSTQVEMFKKKKEEQKEVNQGIYSGMSLALLDELF